MTFSKVLFAVSFVLLSAITNEAIEKINNGNLELLPNREENMTYYSFPTHSDVKEFLNKGKKFY